MHSAVMLTQQQDHYNDVIIAADNGWGPGIPELDREDWDWGASSSGRAPSMNSNAASSWSQKGSKPAADSSWRDLGILSLPSEYDVWKCPACCAATSLQDLHNVLGVQPICKLARGIEMSRHRLAISCPTGSQLLTLITQVPAASHEGSDEATAGDAAGTGAWGDDADDDADEAGAAGGELPDIVELRRDEAVRCLP